MAEVLSTSHSRHDWVLHIIRINEIKARLGTMALHAYITVLC
ncbi:hypothetical protein ABEH27_10265 [Pseudomonas sp. P39-UII1]